ncbi:MAG: DUF2804 domain-containing protein [Anaerolineaceae bacterium]|nr:DUF2804 domain-containing protein [Anaerolineaceae bacterium]
MSVYPHQTLIKQRGKLLHEDGTLAQVGWSPQPMLDCNLEDAHFYSLKFLQGLRIKRWDYYGITTQKRYYSFTISDIGYMGVMFCYVLDFDSGEYEEETIITPFGQGVELARNSIKGACGFENKKLKLHFSVEGENRHIFCEWPEFGKAGLYVDAVMELPDAHQSMNIVIPIERKRFYFNRKINCMPVSGSVRYGGSTIELSPHTALGNQDWGRGVWAFSSHWVWASASGFLADGRRFGLNMGYGFGDLSKATENAFILDGEVQKLGNVKFTFDSQDYKQPWYMTADDDRLQLTMTPFYDRVAETDLLLMGSSVHQLFGHYSGYVVADDGEKINIQGLVGFAEEHFAKW